MIFNILILVFLFIIIKDLQVIKNDILIFSSCNNNTNIQNKIPNPMELFSIFNSQLNMLNNELKNSKLNQLSVD